MGVFGSVVRLAAVMAAAPLQTATAGAAEAARGAEGALRQVQRIMESAWQEAQNQADKATAAVPAAAPPGRFAEAVRTLAGELADAGPGRQRRYVWHRRGRAHIEVRGLAGRSGRKLAQQIPAALRRLDGVDWATVNAATQQILVGFSEERVSLDTVLDTVKAAEEAHGTESESFDRASPGFPGDPSAEYAALAVLAFNLGGAALAAAGRAARLPGAPRAVRLPVAIVDAQPRLRAIVESHLGKLPTELLIGLASSAGHAATTDPFPLAVDAAHRFLALLEARARRLVWERREEELCAAPPQTCATGPPPRPVPLPPGRIEQVAERSSLAALLAAGGLLAWHHDPGEASDLLLATVPRAARLGREAFAAMLAHELGRAGVVMMNSAALRRLDRISAVIIDSGVLTTADGEPDPLAEALIGVARGGDCRLQLTADPAAADLLSWADEVVPAGQDIAGRTRELQAGGAAVLVVTACDDAALAAADVGVALARGDGVCWSADLICGPSLADAWRVLRGLRAARAVSERSAQLAIGGAALGALLVTTRPRHGAARLSPVHGAAATAIGVGALGARRLARVPVPRPAPRGRWHEMTAEQVCDRLRRAAAAAQDRPGAAADRPGAAPAPPGVVTGLARAIAGELKDPLTPVLALGAAASAVVGSGVDALLVGGVMAGNALIGGAQRMRAERALESLLYGEQIAARRETAGGGAQLIHATELRPGDVVALRAADVVPADLRLLGCDGLEVDEATLTGESVPVGKSPEATPGADLQDRSCMLYEGTTVLAGTARGVVVAVGQATETGRAAAAAGQARQAAGVQARLSELTRITIPATGIAGAAVTGLSLAHRLPMSQAVASGIALAVAAVPEGLPLVATVSQLAAARRLSRHGILVRSARTLEALGRVDTFCFDKTGTLTEGRLRVARLAAPDGPVTAADPRGERLLRAAARACPDPEAVVAHATDRAILDAAAERLGADNGWRLEREIPFETSRGYAASIGSAAGQTLLVMKGAPEVMLGHCTRDESGAPLTRARRRAVDRVIQALAGDGLRVIAVAQTSPDPGARPADPPDLDRLAADMALLGFVAIADPPRPAAGETIERLAAAGIRVTMITGDHPVTAAAIARQLGIPGADDVLTGAELDSLPDRERARRVSATTVFARVSPEQKVRVVQAMQRAGRAVAMTGDGANDAAAIRLADVGIGVAGKGSTAARSAADLVLTETDPLRIVAALAEGRALWASVRDAISILVGGNAGEVAFTVLGTALAGRAPLNTRQLLLVNMLTDMLPALAVAVGSGDRAAGPGREEVTFGEPVTLTAAGLARPLLIRGGATAMGASAAWFLGRLTGRTRRADTMGLAALVATQLGQTLLMGRRSPLVLVTCAVSAAALVAIIETPGVSQFFGCTPLGPVAWSIVAAASVTGTAAAALAPRILPAGTGRDTP